MSKRTVENCNSASIIDHLENQTLATPHVRDSEGALNESWAVWAQVQKGRGCKLHNAHQRTRCTVACAHTHGAAEFSWTCLQRVLEAIILCGSSQVVVSSTKCTEEAQKAPKRGTTKIATCMQRVPAKEGRDVKQHES